MAAMNPISIKVTFNGETRRMPRSSFSSFIDLKNVLSSFWGNHDFVLQYTDEDGDVVTVSSDAELQEALSVAEQASWSVFRLKVFQSLKQLRADLDATTAAKTTSPSVESKPPVHFNVECDKSGMNPIKGVRYSVPGADYDLCEDEFTKLSEAERMLFVKIDHPGATPVPYSALHEEHASLSAASAALTDSGGSNTKTVVAAGREPEETAFTFGGGGDTAKAACDKAKSVNEAIKSTEEVNKSQATADVWLKVEAGSASDSDQSDDQEKAAAAKIETPVVETSPKDAEYGTQLAQLSEWGFYDRDANVELLKRYQGRLDRTLNALLDSKLN
jgi:hypothetical protein